MAQTGYLTEREVAAIQTLHRKAPYAISAISHGILSLARATGGMRYEGFEYVYVGEHDECIRADVHKRVEQMRRKELKAAMTAATRAAQESQQGLDL